MDGEEIAGQTIVVNVYTRARARRPRPPKLQRDAVCPDCGWEATALLPNPRREKTPPQDILAQLDCQECGHVGLVFPTRVPAPFIKAAG